MQDASTASLLRWDGSDVGRSTTAAHRREQFRFDGGAATAARPTSTCRSSCWACSAGDPLGLLAFAAEEPAPDIGLRVWATLPLANPVNSDRVNIRLALAPAGST